MADEGSETSEKPGDDGNPAKDVRDEQLIEMYSLLKDQAGLVIDQSQRRLTGGIGSIIAIFGYAVLGDDLRIFVVLPFVIGVLIVVDLEAIVTLGYLNYRMSLIENELSDPENLFVWESKYGMFGDGRRMTVFGVDMNFIYFGFVIIIVAGAYLVSIGLALEAWHGPAYLENISLDRNNIRNTCDFI